MDLSLKKYLLESCTIRSSNPTNGSSTHVEEDEDFGAGSEANGEKGRGKTHRAVRHLPNSHANELFARSLALSTFSSVSRFVEREKIIAERVSSAGRTRRDNFHLSTLVIGSFSGYLVYFSSLPTVHVYVSLYLAQS